MRFMFLGSLFLGCGNPFSSSEELRIIGVWGAQILDVGPQDIAFLSQGRYREEGIQVGVYTVTRTTFDGEATNYTVRIDYNDDTSIQVVIFTTTDTLKISIGNSSGQGPSGGYNRLHSGDGL